MGLVYIKHPDATSLGGPVPQASFEKLWSAKGWEIADDDEVAEHQLRMAVGSSDDNLQVVSVGGTTTVFEAPDVESMTKDELVAEAHRRGIDTTDLTTKADILSVLQS